MKPGTLLGMALVAALLLIGIDLVIYLAGPRSAGSTGVLVSLLVFNLVIFGGLGVYLRGRR